ncbi:MAG TPA: nucleotidyltransferase family protein [Flavisolibacter sp.]|nr:nucleotidyltransferase family protein [Flavisolibacter sp.]
MTTEKKDTTNIGIIILAAGASSRLGRPKQLLPYNNKTLLQHTLQTAQASIAQPVVIVLGADAEKVQNEITGNNVYKVMNAEWKEGMASSIRCGLKALAEVSPAAEGVILMVCDQPFVTASILNDLIAAHQKTGKPVVACGYKDTFGPPVFFHNSLFSELLELKGDIGARGVVRQHVDAVEVIPFPDGTFDVDTEADYERIKNVSKK